MTDMRQNQGVEEVTRRQSPCGIIHMRRTAEALTVIHHVQRIFNDHGVRGLQVDAASDRKNKFILLVCKMQILGFRELLHLISDNNVEVLSVPVGERILSEVTPP